jgi:hypothetical protein
MSWSGLTSQVGSPVPGGFGGLVVWWFYGICMVRLSSSLARETSNQLGIPVLSSALANRRLISPMSGVG